MSYHPAPHPRIAGDRLRTGGPMDISKAEFCMWNRYGTRATLFDAAGGPLDAPQWIPAGSCNSNDYCDGFCRPVGGQSDIERGI